MLLETGADKDARATKGDTLSSARQQGCCALVHTLPKRLFFFLCPWPPCLPLPQAAAVCHAGPVVIPGPLDQAGQCHLLSTVQPQQISDVLSQCLHKYSHTRRLQKPCCDQAARSLCSYCSTSTQEQVRNLSSRINCF